jgi:putative transposase
VLPRQVLPGKFYMITRRCTQRQFLLRPDAETNNIFLYVLAVAAQVFGVTVILPFVASNHIHVVVYDPSGHVVEFYEHLHKLVARAQNAWRGRWENLWASEPPCVVELVGVEDVIAKLVYAATNPVKDGLVERAHQWPGVNGLSDLLNQRVITVRRPRHFFRAGGRMPDTVSLELSIPPALGDADEIRRIVRERVAAVEEEHLAVRRRTGARVLGRRGVLAQRWRDCPKSKASRRNVRPRVAARSQWARAEALLRNRDFLVAYRDARALWLAGRPAVFPPGTYWLRRFAAVTVASAPASAN